MDLILVALIVSGAYVYAPLLRLHASRRFGVSLPPGVLTPDAPAVPVQPKPVELPEKVEEWCQGWFDEWARAEAKQKARKLFAESGDWNVVLVTLESDANRTPSV